MHGPSSSHTAASYHIGSLVRNLLDNEPDVVDIVFAKNGSYAGVYHQQGSDRGFATGLLGWKITDERFLKALEESEKARLKVNFRVEALVKDDHPNAIEIRGESRSGRRLTILARSIGGGAIELRKLNEWPIRMMGDSYDILIELRSMAKGVVVELLAKDLKSLEPPSIQSAGDRMLIHFKASRPATLTPRDHRCLDDEPRFLPSAG